MTEPGVGAALDDARIARYARQLLVPGFGEAAQQRLGAVRVRAVGAGGFVAPALVYLVQAGVGRLWIDDPEPVSPQDVGSWLYPPSAAGRPRTEAAAAALAPLSRFAAIEPYPVGGVPGATLVAAPSPARRCTPRRRRGARGSRTSSSSPTADGGAVVSVPPGAPCYACARSTGAGRPALPGAAAVAALAAQELVQLIAAPATIAGRRFDVVRGIASMRPTARLAGCACGAPRPRAEPPSGAAGRRGIARSALR